MPMLTLKVQNRNGAVCASATGDGEVWLVYEPAYAQGDTLCVISDQPDQFLILCFDDALAPAFVYCAGTICTYPIPFGEARTVFSSRAFEGTRHYLHARVARPEEIAARKKSCTKSLGHSCARRTIPLCVCQYRNPRRNDICSKERN